MCKLGERRVRVTKDGSLEGSVDLTVQGTVLLQKYYGVVVYGVSSLQIVKLNGFFLFYYFN